MLKLNRKKNKKEGRVTNSDRVSIRNSIRFKILALIVSILLLVIFTVGIFIGTYSSRVMEKENETNLTVLNESANDIVSSVIHSNMHTVKLITLTDLKDFMISYLRNENDTTLMTNITRDMSLKLTGNEYIDAYTIMDLENNIILTSKDETYLNQELYDVILQGETTDYLVSDMYILDGRPTLDVSFPIRDVSARFPYGVLFIRVDVTKLVEDINSIKLGGSDSSSTYVVNESGVILYHHDEELIGQAIEFDNINNALANLKEELANKEVDEEAQNDEATEDDALKIVQVLESYTLNGVNHRGAVSEIDNSFNWIIVTTASVKDLYQTTTSILQILVIISVLMIVIGLVISFLISQKISNAILRSEKLINKTSQLNLVDNSQYEHLTQNKDETGKIARAIFNMIGALKNIVRKIIESSQGISDNTKNIQQISSQVEESLSVTTMNTEQLSAGMQQVAATSENIDNAVEMVKVSIDVINEKVKNAVGLSENIEKKAVSIKENSISAKVRAERIYSEVKDNIENSMEKTENSIKEISNFSNVIRNIAEQTNLLSLNASIEAARAGEHGRGFAVVAGEIRQLATQSSDSVKDIEKGVSDIGQSMNAFAKNSQKLLDFVEQDVNKDYVDMVSSSEQYNTDVNEITGIMHELSSTLEVFQTVMSDITKSINETSVTTSESAKEVSEIAEQVNQILRSITSINGILENNSQEVDELITLVSEFKLE